MNFSDAFKQTKCQKKKLCSLFDWKGEGEVEKKNTMSIVQMSKTRVKTSIQIMAGADFSIVIAAGPSLVKGLL